MCLVRGRGATFLRGRILVTPTPAPVRLPGEQYAVAILSSDGKLLWNCHAPAARMMRRR